MKVLEWEHVRAEIEVCKFGECEAWGTSVVGT